MTTASQRVDRVTGTITTADGATSEFSIGTDGVWQQWTGPTGTRRDLGDTVDVLDAMVRGLVEDALLTSDSDTEDEDGK